MYCNKCGAEVPASVRYCHRCGAELPEAVRQRVQRADKRASFLKNIEGKTRGRWEKRRDAIREKQGSLEGKHAATGSRPKRRLIFPAILSCVIVLAIVIGAIVSYTGRDSGLQGKSESVLYLEAYDDKDEFLWNASGFLMDTPNTIVTNYHVIEDAYEIVAYTDDMQEYCSVFTILVYDEDADLAILWCDTPFSAAPLPLADSDLVKQGDKVYAIGYPLGMFNTMSDGIVSSVFAYDNIGIIQTTAAISPGSSGGALLNERGRVIGVTSATLVDGQNMNFAVASNTLRELYENRGRATTLPELFYE